MSAPKSKRDILKNSKERERKIRKAKLVMGLLLLVILVGGFVGLLNCNFLRLTKIVVNGDSAESKEQIQKFAVEKLSGRYLGLVPRNSVFFVSRTNLTSSLERQFPRLAQAKIKWPRLNSLEINISDKNARLIWCDGDNGREDGKCFYVNADGEIYSEAPNFSEMVMIEIIAKLPPEPIGQKILASSTVEKISALTTTIDRLAPKLAGVHSPIEISYLEPLAPLDVGDWQIFCGHSSSSWRVIFNENKSLSHLVGSLVSALNSEAFLVEWSKKAGRLDYLDLRFDNKIFYRFK